jgi:multidrug efflux pump subunit AcrB
MLTCGLAIQAAILCLICRTALRATRSLKRLAFAVGAVAPGGGDAIDVQFYGADAQTLKDASDALKEQLVQFPEVSAVEDDLPYDKEELILELTAKGQALGFTIDGLGRDLRARLNGIEAATYPVGARSATIRVGVARSSFDPRLSEPDVGSLGYGSIRTAR